MRPRLEREWLPRGLEELWQQREVRREDVTRVFFQEQLPDHWRLVPPRTRSHILGIRRRVKAWRQCARRQALQRVLATTDLYEVLVALTLEYAL